jgi:outer membrane protein TolC
MITSVDNNFCRIPFHFMQDAQRHSTSIKFLLTIVILIAPLPVLAQQTTATPLTIRQAVEDAIKNYPSITVSQEQINAAAAGIDLARTAYLPHVDTLAQVNRATRNNMFGLLLPQGVIPSISGPVIGSNNFGTVWGSAVGGLVTWEPFDFGLRAANVSAANATRSRAQATLKRAEFEVSVATADACLTMAAAQETVQAAEAAVDRSEVLVRSVHALVDAQLRPGADASRAEAELAAARAQLAQAQQAVEVAKTVVAQFAGLQPQQVILAAPQLLELPSDEAVPSFEAAQNPFTAEQNAVVEQGKAELRVLEKSYIPHFFTQGSAYSRGTGASVNGKRLGALNGLAPDTQNYALGFSVTFPAFDFASVHAREAAQSATIRAETARYQQISTELTAQWNAAVATLSGSRSVAMNTPVEVSAATAAVQQATARYQSGLGTIVEVADAQRLLTQAQIDDALARLNVWRALLHVAVSSGDIQPFLTGASP